ncbi:hypothetical protein [Aquimarina aquimarini]|uniref:hypothetical protein n=1 Tax=Aquimarina aquimarini TaxID=1191734 RepID=UPI00131F1303|nr:hypothetical protein [Aquimarina aquimarini]
MEREMILHKVTYTDQGKKIEYEYTMDNHTQKFFNKDHAFYSKYDIDVSTVPISIAVIPFLSNMLPISWFSDFTIKVNELDEDFYQAMQQVKIEFQKQFPEYELKGELIVNTLVKNTIKGDKSAMLFSGGVDAYATYIRVFDKTPDLVTIHGADIEIEDHSQWKDFTDFVESETLLEKNKKVFIETNVRKFYTYQVELLLKDIGWWGKVQHGLSLIGSLAPVSYIYSYTSVYIASSYTEQINIAWGSTPEIDEKISWGSVRVFHDGYDLQRQDKVDLITAFARKTATAFKLRVCYSENREEFNCSRCEKCYRTILGIILNGNDPNHFGFEVDKRVYSNMFETLHIGSASRGLQYFWWELMEKAKKSKDIFIFDDEKIENVQLDRIRSGEIDQLLEDKINKPKRTIEKIKFVLRNRFSGMYNLYKKLRYN